jgi:membrane-associated phospholipid phosphatase
MFNVVLGRLRSGIPDEELNPAFDRRVFPAYGAIAILAVTAAVVIKLTGFSIAPVIWYRFFSWPVLFLIAGPLMRRIGNPRAAGFLESVGLLYGQGLVAILAIAPLAAISLPFADQQLVYADHILGFDWYAFALWNRPVLPFLKLFYTSFVWQPALVLLVLFRTGQDDRAWRLVAAAALALVITVFLFPFAPAEGPFIYFHLGPNDLPNLHAGWRAPEILHLIKDHGARRLDDKLVEGLVSIPSYHAAACLLLAWASWKLRRARWLFLVLNLLMAFSTIVVGAHYLVDIIAGVIVGAGALWAVDRLWNKMWPSRRKATQSLA